MLLPPCRRLLCQNFLQGVWCTYGSRYKSLYAHLAEADHSNLKGLAAELYHQDRMKHEILKPPETESKIEMSYDWNEIHESTVMYGSPELADHLSGQIYMRATMYEDKSSQAMRLADHVCYFTNEQLKTSLELCHQWPLKTVVESDTLQSLVRNIDNECHNRNVNDTWTSQNELLKTVFLFSLNVLKSKEAKFMSYFVSNPGQIWQTYPVFYLLIAGFCNRDICSPEVTTNLLEFAMESFESSNATELAIIYAGLKSLFHEKSALEELKQKIEGRYGFRLQ